MSILIYFIVKLIEIKTKYHQPPLQVPWDLILGLKTLITGTGFLNCILTSVRFGITQSIYLNVSLYSGQVLHEFQSDKINSTCLNRIITDKSPLVTLSYNYTMRFIGYDSIETR